GGDRVAPGDQVVGRAGRGEIAMGEAAPFGRAGQNALFLLSVLMQRIVEPGDHPRGVAEAGMRGDVLDALAIDPDFAAVIEAVEVFLAGVGQQRRIGALGLGHRRSSLWAGLVSRTVGAIRSCERYIPPRSPATAAG